MKYIPFVLAPLLLAFNTEAGTVVSNLLNTTLCPLITFDHGDELISIKPSYPPEKIQTSLTTIAGKPFNQCLTLDIKEPGSSPYALNLQFFHANQWTKGDKGMISFWCRSIATSNRYGASSIKLQYKPSYADWRGHLETDLYLEKKWKQVILPFTVEIEAPETPQCVLSFFLGGVDPHKIQLADLKVLGFGRKVPFEALPHSKSYYPGMEPDAAWREAAHDRIEHHRKANLKLKVVDAAGRPLKGTKVRVKLKRHNFGFGAAIRTPLLVSPKVPEAERKKYSDILTRSCSKITPTNAMKWKYYDSFRQYMPGVIEWCKKHDMTLRGHLLIWPGFERLPEGYDLHKTDPAAFRNDLIRHITEHVNRFPDAFSEWDVMNEPYTEHDFMDLLGEDAVLEWFETARAANPTYLNYINDYGILSDNNAEHRDNYFEWIKYIINNDAPLDGIGFQGHFKTATPPELILERIDRYAAFGKKMQITEFDFDHADPDLQARFFEDFVTLVYSHPQMSALINWIYLEDSFRPRAALYRKDFTPTAMGQVWERMLTKQWHTEETLRTDSYGIVNLRGYKGIYDIHADHRGQKSMHSIQLTANTEKEITL